MTILVDRNPRRSKRPDKFPDLDPSERGIFDRILAAVKKMRQDQRSADVQLMQERRMESAMAMHRLRERERRGQEARDQAAASLASKAAMRDWSLTTKSGS